jgi:hypothetical protein
MGMFISTRSFLASERKKSFADIICVIGSLDISLPCSDFCAHYQPYTCLDMTVLSQPYEIDTPLWKSIFLKTSQVQDITGKETRLDGSQKHTNANGIRKGISDAFSRGWKAMSQSARPEKPLTRDLTGDGKYSRSDPKLSLPILQISEPTPIYSLSLEKYARREISRGLLNRRRGHDKNLSLKNNGSPGSHQKSSLKSKHNRNGTRKTTVSVKKAPLDSPLATFLHSPSPPSTPYPLQDKNRSSSSPVSHQETHNTRPASGRGQKNPVLDIPDGKSSSRNRHIQIFDMQGHLCPLCGVVHPIHASGYAPLDPLIQGYSVERQIQDGLQSPRKRSVSHRSRRVLRAVMPTISEEQNTERMT